MNHVAEMRR